MAFRIALNSPYKGLALPYRFCRHYKALDSLIRLLRDLIKLLRLLRASMAL